MTTLPGDIPGLLRRGSPVVPADPGPHDCACPAVVVAIDLPGPWSVLICGTCSCGAGAREDIVEPSDVALDFSDPTGRAHAAWWAHAMTADTFETDYDDDCVVTLACDGAEMSEADVARLRGLVLRLAGRLTDDEAAPTPQPTPPRR